MISLPIMKTMFIASAVQDVLKPLAKQLALSPVKITAPFVPLNALSAEELFEKKQRDLILPLKLHLVMRVFRLKKDKGVKATKEQALLMGHVAPVKIQERLKALLPRNAALIQAEQIQPLRNQQNQAVAALQDLDVGDNNEAQAFRSPP